MSSEQEPIKVVIFYGGDRNRRRNKALQLQCRKFVKGAEERGSICEMIWLGDYEFQAQNAKPTYRLRRALYPLRDAFLKADVVVHATLVHWGKPSALTSLFIDQVEAPLEWSGPREKDGWEGWGKTIVMITLYDDDGASGVNAITLERGVDRGMFPIGWGSHRKHLGMERSEFDYQDKPEIVARIAVEHARRMRGFPDWTTFLK